MIKKICAGFAVIALLASLAVRASAIQMCNIADGSSCPAGSASVSCSNGPNQPTGTCNCNTSGTTSTWGCAITAGGGTAVAAPKAISKGAGTPAVGGAAATAGVGANKSLKAGSKKGAAAGQAPAKQ